MLKLDSRDIKILSILQREGRITKTALAEKVNLSPTPCWERLKRLEKAGLIEGYGARLSAEFFGKHTLVFMEAELSSHRSRDFAQFEAAVRQIDEVQSCWAVAGGIDYLIKIVVAGIDDYQQLVDKMLHAEIGLKRYYTYVVTRRIKESETLPDSLLRASSTNRD